jgi:hypothetical protein
MKVRLAQGRIADIERHLTGAQSAVKRAAALTQRLLAFRAARRWTRPGRPEPHRGRHARSDRAQRGTIDCR